MLFLIRCIDCHTSGNCWQTFPRSQAISPPPMILLSVVTTKLSLRCCGILILHSTFHRNSQWVLPSRYALVTPKSGVNGILFLCHSHEYAASFQITQPKLDVTSQLKLVQSLYKGMNGWAPNTTLFMHPPSVMILRRNHCKTQSLYSLWSLVCRIHLK